MKNNPATNSQKHASTQYAVVQMYCIYNLQQIKLSQKGGQNKGSNEAEDHKQIAKLVFSHRSSLLKEAFHSD
jgi:hypothetical protein